MIWSERIQATLAAKKVENHYRQRNVTEIGEKGRRLLVDGREFLNFSSNDYLGLSQHPSVIDAWQEGAKRYGVGSAGSGHIIGYSRPLFELEEALAHWLGYDRAIVYPSGFSANQAVIKTLIEKEDRIIADRLSHASLMEAAIFSEGSLRRFQHNDLQSLKKRLTDIVGQTLVVTEGIFSMDGDEAPLVDIAALAKRDNTWLMVDDAHGIGVHGKKGRGTCDKQGIHPEILVVTFGKAFGVSGAAVLCSETVAEYFIQSSRSLIYSTAISPAHAYTLLSVLKIVENGDDLRERLQQNIQQYRQGIKDIGLETLSESAIQPIILGETEKSLRVATILQQQGLGITAIRPPTVPPHSSRLRITLTAAHTKEDIQQLLETLYESNR